MLQTDVELWDRKYISSYSRENIFYLFISIYCRRKVRLLTKRTTWILQYIELHINRVCFQESVTYTIFHNNVYYNKGKLDAVYNNLPFF